MANAFAVVAFDGQPPGDVPMDSQTGFLFFEALRRDPPRRSRRAARSRFRIRRVRFFVIPTCLRPVFPTSLRLPAITGNDWRVDDVLKGPAGALITTLERAGGGHRRAFFSFGVADSDLPLKAAFPILLSNTVQWLSETKKTLPATSPPEAS